MSEGPLIDVGEMTIAAWQKALDEARGDFDRLQETKDNWHRSYVLCRQERDRYREALEQISEQQPKTIDWLRANGIVFDGPLGTDPDNWEHVAFSIYNDLCEVDGVARAALATPDTPPPGTEATVGPVPTSTYESSAVPGFTLTSSDGSTVATPDTPPDDV